MKKTLLFLCLSALGLGGISGQTKGVDPAVAAAAANAGDRAAQYELWKLMRGQGGAASSNEQAEYWLEKSANKGYTPALLTLTGRYEIARDFANAARWYRKLADSDSPLSSSGDWQLGNYAQQGKVGEPDYVEAASWYRKAADKGNCLGADSLGILEQSGKLGTTNFSEVASWYRKAADGGCETGASHLGFLYYYGQGVPKDLKLATLWWHKAAAKGSVAAELQIGALYENGLGVKRDFVQAASWYEKAVKQEKYPTSESATAEASLGMLYYYGGFGLPRDFAQGGSWLSRAVSDGYDPLSPDQSVALADLYERGEGVPQNFDKSLELYVQSGELGSAQAQIHLASIYQSGVRVEQDYEKAYYWFSLAALCSTGTRHTKAVQQRDLTALRLTRDQLSSQQNAVQTQYELIRKFSVMYGNIGPDSSR